MFILFLTPSYKYENSLKFNYTEKKNEESECNWMGRSAVTQGMSAGSDVGCREATRWGGARTVKKENI